MWHSDRRQRLVQVPVWTNRQTPDQWGFCQCSFLQKVFGGVERQGALRWAARVPRWASGRLGDFLEDIRGLEVGIVTTLYYVVNS